MNRKIKNKRYIIVIALIVFLFVLVAFSQSTQFIFNKEINNETQSTRIQIGDAVFFVEIVDTVKKRQKGLSGRKFLEESRGMLFIYNEVSFGGIWMKDMLFSIDIIWLDKDLRVVSIKENATPNSYPEVFRPVQEVWYVFEVNAGAVEKSGIIIGEQMKIF